VSQPKPPHFPADKYEPHHLELIREAVTMALYISLSLLAVLLATQTPTADDGRVQVALTTLFTGLGLVAAHHIAFRMSSRLVNAGRLDDHSRHALGAQALGGIPVAVLAMLPVLVLGVEPGALVSELLLLGLVCVVGWRAVRQAVSRGRAAAYLLTTVTIASGVIVLKLITGH